MLSPDKTEQLIGELFQRVIELEKRLKAFEDEAVKYGDKVHIGYNVRGEEGFSSVIQGWIDKKPSDLNIKEMG